MCVRVCQSINQSIIIINVSMWMIVFSEANTGLKIFPVVSFILVLILILILILVLCLAMFWSAAALILIDTTITTITTRGSLRLGPLALRPSLCARMQCIQHFVHVHPLVARRVVGNVVEKERVCVCDRNRNRGRERERGGEEKRGR